MSRINELKKQNPFLTIDGIDIINNLVVKSKYTEMLVNLIKNDRMKEHDNNNRRNDYVYELREYGYDEEVLKNMDTAELMKLTLFMGHYIGYNNFRMFKEFVDLNERNLINQNDITKYKTFRDIELQISLSELKNMDKELSKQTHKLYEDNEWLVIKPMSYQASLKYGASTKWCTASKNESDYYFSYSKRGILIYCINKKTGELMTNKRKMLLKILKVKSDTLKIYNKIPADYVCFLFVIRFPDLNYTIQTNKKKITITN